ncbi:protein kinase [Microbulbifer bruguierae]|uniref:Protein kinase n=1 Tax=Microbulbifer bruguierae TaxID=3029061 RepID=A0ABY8NBE7_9GAMM|nr:serine/threonine-protein kinase [Microbulbifer bruguierae]WGL16123.1 protein kinase [Microbulbifer bruguierae]
MDIADPKVAPSISSGTRTDTQSDRYRIQSTLGAGGMGVVYLAEDLKLHRQVAIKKLKDDAASQNARERIQQEARLLAQLNHPNIVALHDVLDGSQEGENGNIALVMEYIEGTTLRAWMREQTPSLQQKLSLLMQICQGLQQAHDLGIIHRDLKSDNILITTSASGKLTAKITDFGIAKSLQLDEKTLTAENQLAGTITAMSPEQILGKTLDARSDLFSLGTIAYELLCGSRPFDKHDAGALAMANRITNEPHTPPQQAWAEIPEPLAILLDKLLAKDPAQRPQSAQLVYQGFELLHKQGLESDSEEFTATLTDLFTRQKDKNRRRWQRVLAGIAAALVVGAGGYWGWKEFTRLEPQYIAVMPVQINGEIRGEENAKALTRTMVRQALMNSVSQLKASALVSFEPKAGQDFEAQLQALQDKGVTDALFARLECVQVRCEVELQRISPKNEQIKQQLSFVFLSEKRQEAQFRINNDAIQLFDAPYQREELKLLTMSDGDYSRYLDILSRLEAKELTYTDLTDLTSLAARYPQNVYIYQGLTDVAARLFVIDGSTNHLEIALRALEMGQNQGISEANLVRLKLFIYGLGNYTEQYQQLMTELKKMDIPAAELKYELALHLYRKSKFTEALREALDANRLNPSAAPLYLAAISQGAMGRYEASRNTLNQVTMTYPNHWSSYSALGVIELELGNLDNAEAAITAIPEKLRSWRTISNLGVAYFLRQNHHAALTEFKKVLQIVPDDVPTIGQLAEVHLALGDQHAAETEFSMVLKLTEGTDNPELLRYRALALANTGAASESIKLITQLLRASSEDTDIKHAATQVYTLAAEWRSASLYISELLEQGMSTEWFQLPIYRNLCTQPEVTESVKTSICN